MLAALAEGMCWFCQVIPLESFCCLEALPPPSWTAGGRGALFWSTFPVVTPLAHTVPSVESRVPCAHWGFDNSLLFFFFLVIAES